MSCPAAGLKEKPRSAQGEGDERGELLAHRASGEETATKMPRPRAIVSDEHHGAAQGLLALEPD